MMMNRFAVLGLALMLCLVVPLPESANAACKVSASAAGIKHGSSVQEASVTICAVAKTVQPARKSTVVQTKTVAPVTRSVPAKSAKPAVPAKPVTRPMNQYDKHRGWATPPVKVTKVIVVKKVVTKTPVKPPVKKPTAIPKKITSNLTLATRAAKNLSSAQATFGVQSLSISVTPGQQLSVGQQAAFTTNASTHFGRGRLLNKTTEVRFQLVGVSWTFGDGAVSSSPTSAHAFDELGEFTVTATANYQVAYRFSGSSTWITASESMTTQARVQITVSAEGVEQGPAPTGGAVLLVGESCWNHPEAYGCS